VLIAAVWDLICEIQWLDSRAICDQLIYVFRNEGNSTIVHFHQKVLVEHLGPHVQ